MVDMISSKWAKHFPFKSITIKVLRHHNMLDCYYMYFLNNISLFYSCLSCCFVLDCCSSLWWWCDLYMGIVWSSLRDEVFAYWLLSNYPIAQWYWDGSPLILYTYIYILSFTRGWKAVSHEGIELRTKKKAVCWWNINAAGLYRQLTF